MMIFWMIFWSLSQRSLSTVSTEVGGENNQPLHFGSAQKDLEGSDSPECLPLVLLNHFDLPDGAITIRQLFGWLRFYFVVLQTQVALFFCEGLQMVEQDKSRQSSCLGTHGTEAIDKSGMLNAAGWLIKRYKD